MESGNKVHRAAWIKLFLVVLCCFILLPSSSYAFFGGKVKSFTADQVVISPDGKVLGTSKLYITPDVYRMDGLPTGGQGGMTQNLTILGFKKQNKQYIYNHDKKLFFESQLDEDGMMEKMKSYENADSETILGKEKVSGYKCVKKEVTTTMTMMGTKITSTEIVWQSDKFEFPLRIQMEGGQIMEFRNIDKGKPAKKLFRRPVGYKKVNNMMAVMGMDFAARVRQDMASEEEEQNTASQSNIENMNLEEMMAKIQQSMGENANPEQMAQMQQVMAQAMNQAKQTNMKKGAAEGLWQIIPKRPGDKVGTEIKSPNVYTVTMGSNASFQQVFTFYQQKLKPEGWQDGGMYIQNGMGTCNMMKGQQMLMIAWADNPGMEGNYKLFYNLKLTGPDI